MCGKLILKQNIKLRMTYKIKLLIRRLWKPGTVSVETMSMV